MVTIEKPNLKGCTYKRVSMEQMVEWIRNGQFDCERFLPSINFVSEMVKQKRNVKVLRLSMFCHLQLLNLPGEVEVEEKVRLACRVPYSMLVFRGRDKRSLHIVCRYELCPSPDKSIDEKRMLRYLDNAFKQLHYAYSVQLHASLENSPASLTQSITWESDPELYYNPSCQVLFVNDEDLDMPTYVTPPTGLADQMKMQPQSEYEDQCERYGWAYRRALQESHEQTKNNEEKVEKCLCLLAEYCHLDGIDMEVAISHTLWKSDYWKRENHVRIVFANAYDKELSRNIPYGSVERSALMMMRVEAFLNSRYQLRRNELTGVVEFRNRSNYHYSYQPLTQPDINSMTTEALKMGLGTWDKDLRRILDSRDIPSFDPLYDYLSHLPAWDGRDRISEFASRIPSDTPRYAYYLHIWLRSMVAHWLGKDRRHGNALVPLLIGNQGCGKTSLCNLLLPNELKPYYNDKVDFRSEADIMAALSNFALINIDEFDSLKKSQQPVLKYLLSKSDVKFRPPYGRAVVERRRFASFIGTTNQRHPLIDNTGSRRFACILISEGRQIDFSTPLEHDQFYAQILHEINEGERYWLDDSETTELQKQNTAFLHITDEGAMIDSLFLPSNDPNLLADRKSPNWRSVSDVIDLMQQRYPYLQRTQSLNIRIGRFLTEKRFATCKTNRCMIYYVMLR